jgi:starch synthase
VRVLYVSTEVSPALKTGGLADVNGALPRALIAQGADVRLLLPAFPALVQAAGTTRRVTELGAAFGAPRVGILQGRIGDVPAYLIDAPVLYGREGNPYVDEHGRDWPDNHLRFGMLGWAAARFRGGAIDGWEPDIVHCHDWHAALAPAYLATLPGPRPATVFTIHNLAFQGRFPAETFAALGLPAKAFTIQGVEFHGSVNFMKAGLYYADHITTVSPTYAREVQSEENGFGMDGLLRERSAVLTGILNGVDSQEWSPAGDPRIAATYDAEDLAGKDRCKAALRRTLGLSADASGPVFGVVSRLTGQKGLDWVLQAVPKMTLRGGQLALLGSGDRELEDGFLAAARRFRRSVAVRIGYDETLAHRIIAGADVILVPSRFEPCGLTQLYGLAYGTLPLVRRVGGLADTVMDADLYGIAAGSATGFVFDEPSHGALEKALDRTFALWGSQRDWKRVQAAGMRQDFGWAPSARRYLELYRSLRPHA